MASGVFYSFLLFFISILLPLVPAIILYKIFPDQKFNITGTIGLFKINAVGAVGFYIAILIADYKYTIPYIVENINDEKNKEWVVQSSIFLKDRNGNIWQDKDKIKKIQFILTPETIDSKITGDPNHIIFSIHKNLNYLQFKCEDSTAYLSRQICLSSTEDNDNMKIQVDNEKRIIKLGKIILEEGNSLKSQEGGIKETKNFGPPTTVE